MQPIAAVRYSNSFDLDPSTLTEAEHGRWSSLHHPTDRADFLAARKLARELLGAPKAVFAQRCHECGGSHGRPVLIGRSDLHVSWAHARGIVAAAVGTAPIGIDVEFIDHTAPPFETLTGSVEDWVRWTRIEALVKRGHGSLDEALTWPLTGPAEPGGASLSSLLEGHHGVVTDMVGPGEAWVATVVADQRARIRLSLPRGTDTT